MSVFDKIEKIGSSLVQHGPNNDRVYLMKLHLDDLGKIEEQLQQLAITNRYSKIFAVVPEQAIDSFLKKDFKIEASIPNFIMGKTRGYFISRFFNKKRAFISKKEQQLIDEIKESANAIYDSSKHPLPRNFRIEKLSKNSIAPMAKIYRDCFKVYPFPIFDEGYLKEQMKKNTTYFGVFHKNSLAAVASADVDMKNQNAEMTDFATSSKHLGKNLSYYLLQEMDGAMKNMGVKTTYTIARATSHGMNKTFGRSYYLLGGTLVNNTLIGDSIETMNVWYKNL